MPSLLRSLLRRVRWTGGRGWAPQDFADRYRARPDDAWAYGKSAAHDERFRRIIAALPQGRRFAHIFEGGCAEGHLSERLAPVTERLTSCDFCADAVSRCARRLTAHPHATVIHADLRHGLPAMAGPPPSCDLFVFSDVLYYLSSGEIRRLLADASRTATPDAMLLFANEWNEHYRHMSDPADILTLIHQSQSWQAIANEPSNPSQGQSLTISLFQLTRPAAPQHA